MAGKRKEFQMLKVFLPLPGGKVKVYRREKAEELDFILLEWELDKMMEEADGNKDQ